jgi:hypothetical protein
MEFRVIDGYPYEIYEDGRIFRTERKSRNGKRTLSRIKISPSKATNGYLVVKLYSPKDGCYRKFYLHRLVYMAFNGEIAEKMEIDHIDGDRSNSALSNLRLCNHAVNCRNPRSLERYKRANALSTGKFNRDRMQAAKSQENKERLRHEYMFMLKETGSVGVYAFMKKAHCNYYTALKVIAEMQDKSEKNQ